MRPKIKKRICFRRLLTDLQGDVKVSSYQGNIISSKRFMGPNLELDTDNGDIRGNFNLCQYAEVHVYTLANIFPRFNNLSMI